MYESPWPATNLKSYDAAAEKIRKELGSYDSMSRQIFAETEVDVSGQTVRRWFKHRRLPADYAFLLITMAGLKTDLIFAFHPWLRNL